MDGVVLPLLQIKVYGGVPPDGLNEIDPSQSAGPDTAVEVSDPVKPLHEIESITSTVCCMVHPK